MAVLQCRGTGQQKNQRTRDLNHRHYITDDLDIFETSTIAAATTLMSAPLLVPVVPPDFPPLLVRAPDL
jgi:hypothetical protein